MRKAAGIKVNCDERSLMEKPLDIHGLNESIVKKYLHKYFLQYFRMYMYIRIENNIKHILFDIIFYIENNIKHTSRWLNVTFKTNMHCRLVTSNSVSLRIKYKLGLATNHATVLFCNQSPNDSSRQRLVFSP